MIYASFNEKKKKLTFESVICADGLLELLSTDVRGDDVDTLGDDLPNEAADPERR